MTTADILVAGIDIGSTYTKAVLIDSARAVRATAIRRSGYKPATAASVVFDDLVANAGVPPACVTYIATTGYGRYMVPFRHTQITELTCHAVATSHHFPDVRTILDIGGQDIKAIRIDEQGRVRAFRLNDKCAAGTGAFLEKTARYLGLQTSDIGAYALRAEQPVEISSVCAVFAESEVINHLASGVAPEDIMEGAIVALGGRAVQLMKRVGLEPDYALAGGMTNNPAMVAALENKLGAPLLLPPDGLGQLNGAFGAALLGARRVTKLLAEGRAIVSPTSADETKPRRWSTYVAPVSAGAGVAATA
ncbi:MAG TPA: acyl-CoA dehydratase activase [Ktedonobacterales bacterium]|jgi:predicted CoA-substrate-specific enzyme activase|nr:acyl-CoA dehydratase activase [Ktedonobacterales bacterium]